MSGPYTKIENLPERIAALLIQQFREPPKINALVLDLGGMEQIVEDAAWDTATLRWIDSAEGQQLDGLGEILGELRYGRPDDIYRLWLRFRIFINSSKGTPSDMMEILRFVTNEGAPGGRVKYWENWPASFQLFTDGLFIPGLPDPELAGELELDDQGLFLLDDFGSLLVNPGVPYIANSLIELMNLVRPVATGIMGIGFSLGAFPFSFAGNFEQTQFNLDDGGTLEFNDGSEFWVNAGDTTLPEGGSFASFALQDFALDDGGLLEFDSGDTLAVVESLIDTVGAGALVSVLQG